MTHGVRRRYTAMAGAEPAGADAVTWEMSGEPVTEFAARDHWFVSTPEQLAEELAPHGLRVAAGDPVQHIQVITR